jgi:serine/threonine protein kinase
MTEDTSFGARPEQLRRLYAMGLDEPEEADLHAASWGTLKLEPGSRVGRYTLLRLLGEGGMGIVYLAEQDRPVKRQVALKLIKAGMDSARVIARFETERQALATLDHPHVAHVFDAGATDQGRPYFVMEYVPGLPIDGFCDEHKLSLKERLILFVQVCQAIHHAHQKGFIHRDIKPSNILVHLKDGKPVPMVIDFGVARALNQPFNQETMLTQQGQWIGTPEYMSPEQIDQTDESADTRSDVYSLGVLLYVLLAGVMPFESIDLRKGGVEDMHRIIRGKDPKTPSTRLLGLKDRAAQVAANRQTTVRSLAKHLHRELEWIPLKAMRKEREQRYDSAAELAEDLQNYMTGKPLRAGPPRVSYRIMKLVKRHRAGVIATLVAATGISLAIVVAVTLYMQAEFQSARTQALSRFLSGSVLTAINPYRPEGGDVTPLSILDAVSRGLEGKLQNSPLEEALIRHQLGLLYSGYDQYQPALEHQQRALDIRRRKLGGNHVSTISSLVNLGSTHMDHFYPEKADPLLREAVALGVNHLGEESITTLYAKSQLASNCRYMCEYDQALALFHEVLTTARKVGGDPHEEAIWATRRVGLVYLELGDYDEADRWLEKALPLFRGSRNRENAFTPQFAGLLGRLYLLQGRWAESEVLATEALALNRRMLGEQHMQTPQFFRDLIQAKVGMGKIEEARDLWGQFRQACKERGNLGSAYSVPPVPADSLAGSSDYNAVSDTYTVKGSGIGLGEALDEMHFAHKTLTGDGSVTVRVDSVARVDGYAEAGIMMRDALNARSAHASVLMQPPGRIAFHYRTAQGGPAQIRYSFVRAPKFPHWLKLERRGHVFKAHHSRDGMSWEEVGRHGSSPTHSAAITLQDTVYAGLVATSSNPGCLAEARISHLQTAGDVRPEGPFAVSRDIGLFGSDVNAGDGLRNSPNNREGPHCLPGTDLTLEAAAVLSLRYGATAGSMVYDKAGGVYTIHGSGTDIWYAPDQFHYAHNRIRGDCTIAARIDSLEPVHSWAKAGVMIRETASSTSPHAAVFVTPSRRVSFQYRLAPGQDSLSIHTNLNTITLPHWVKLIREGNRFRAQHSQDGKRWSDLEGGSGNGEIVEWRPAVTQVDMKDPVHIGLAVTSHAGPTVLAEAKIAQVTVAGNDNPSSSFLWSEDIGFQLIALPKE